MRDSERFGSDFAGCSPQDEFPARLSGAARKRNLFQGRALTEGSARSRTLRRDTRQPGLLYRDLASRWREIDRKKSQAMRSLHPLLPIRTVVLRLRTAWWNRFWGMDVHPTARISLSAKLDRTYPVGIHIGEYTTVTFGVAILAHDMVRNYRAHTIIGKNCFIGAHSIVLPGVTIGDGSIVAAGSVVNRDIPAGSIAAGNPAKVIKTDIETVRYGILAERYRPMPDPSPIVLNR